METNLNFKFNNNYHIELIDSETGDIKQEGDFHNVVLNRFGELLSLDGSTSESGYDLTRGITFFTHIGVGSGTSQPLITDNGLGRELWTRVAEKTPLEWLDDYSARVSGTVTFPANASYVGNVTEVGVLGSRGFHSYAAGNEWLYPGYITHSLLTDSEGQPISFNKTDLDILKVTVTIELTLENTSPNFVLYKKNRFIKEALGRSLTGGSFTHSLDNKVDFELCKFKSVMQDSYELSADSAILGTTLVGASSFKGSYNPTLRTARIFSPVGRWETSTIPSESYFSSFRVRSFGYWLLPNEEIFPTYTISNINIGIGDGSKNQFLNPLSYFKKNTEKIYKNGVLLTRDIDYTVNNKSNVNCLNEFCYSPIKTSSEGGFYQDGYRYSFLDPTIQERRESSLYPAFEGGYNKIANKIPFYFEFAEPTTLNFLRSGELGARYDGSNGDYKHYFINHPLILKASEDGIEYNEVARGIFSADPVDSYSIQVSLDFEDTTAKYWSLTIDNDSNNSSYFIYIRYDTKGMVVGRRDPYITFTEAPAEGDILTMDVGMDLIMKNSNFVVDGSCSFNFTY